MTPLVEESEVLDVISAEDRFAELKKVFGDQVALVHGRMSASEKQAAMEGFANGDTKILVATTVIEVGVDVPNATIMIIEHAERFGLAQLHQLRGRVGRGAAALGLPAALQGAAQRDRRRPGSRPSSRPRTASSSPRRTSSCAARATCSARGSRACRAIASPCRTCTGICWSSRTRMREAALERNPGLTGDEGEALRTLLYLFRKDLALPLIRAG